jgi:SAM-dependent methyltransferase
MVGGKGKAVKGNAWNLLTFPHPAYFLPMSWLPRKYRFNHCPDIDRVWPELQRWYSTALGKKLAEREQALLETALADLFGYHLLQVGRLTPVDWLTSSRVSHHIVIDFPPPHEPGMGPTHLLAQPHLLPCVSDSIDIVVLPHVLEFSHYPHAVLREVERILIPEGVAVLLVFNPWSFWNVWRLVLGWRARVPWCARFLSTTRLKDWLALLGFDVLSIQGYFFRPPIQSEKLMRRCGIWERLGTRFWPSMGAAKLLIVRKRVTTFTPIRPRWATQPQAIVRPGLAEPFQHKYRIKR